MNKDFVNRWCKVLLLIILGFTLGIAYTSFVSSIEDDQLVFCDSFNITSFTECIYFWNNITDILNVTCLDCPECINQTCVNQTIEIEKNCTDEFQWFKYQLDHDLEMARINSTCEEGEGCDERVLLEVLEARNDERSKCFQVSNPTSSTTNYAPWIIALVFVAFLLFVFKDKIKQFSEKSSSSDFLDDKRRGFGEVKQAKERPQEGKNATDEFS